MSAPANSLALYRQMLRIRRVEEGITEAYPRQEIRCPVHLSIGQEAAAVGVCSALEPQDYVLSGHRSHAHYLARGGDLRAMIAELYGRATGCCGGKGGSMHFIDLEAGFLGATPIVASTIPIAVGAAFGSVRQGKPRVVVAFFGEAATEEGVFHEALNFASLHRLPVVFVCENNLYSVYSPLSVRQPSNRSCADLAAGHGVRAVRGSGNDVLEVLTLAADAVVRARAGEGPVFLELATYRWREHCGTSFDNHIGYRTEEEFQLWRERCPLEILGSELRERGELDDASEAAMRGELDAEVAAAIQFARESPFPDASELLTGVYAPEESRQTLREGPVPSR